MPELRHVYSTIDARDRIIDGALTVFSDKGFGGATVREIAHAAGVSPGLIHHHFKDKETLWNLVGERISEEFIEAVKVEDREVMDAASFRQLITNYMSYWKAHPRALRFQLWRVLGAQEDERRSRSKLLNEYFVPRVKEAQQAGIVRDDVPAGLTMITLGALIQYVLHSRVEMEDALGVTGDQVPEEEQLLDYIFSLVAPRKETK